MIRRVAAAVAVLALAALAAMPAGLARWRCLSMETRLTAHKCCKPTRAEDSNAAQARLGKVCCEREADRIAEAFLDGRSGSGDGLLTTVSQIAVLPVGTLAPPLVTLPTPRGRGSPPPPLLVRPTATIVIRV